jgi:hypothetical protein
MLAIVIPYYKRTFFEETLQSLANQTDKRFQVFIGDFYDWIVVFYAFKLNQNLSY